MATAIINLSHSLKITKHLLTVNCFTFPGGEEHIKIIPEKIPYDKIIIASSMTNSSDVMKTLLATNAIRDLYRNAKIDLFSPYFPYARQDRRMLLGEPLSIKVMSEIINNQKYNRVHVLDPHSDVTCALINNLKLLDHNNFIKLALNSIIQNNLEYVTSNLLNIKDIPDPVGRDIFKMGEYVTPNLSNIKGIPDPFCIVSPDAGAEKKIYKIAKYLKIDDNKIILGRKQRNVITGQLGNSSFVGDIENKICVIIDDIIDGGGTFIQLATELKRCGAKKVYLIVSHGIFSKNLDTLKSVLDGIYTTDSFRSINDNFVTQIGIHNFCSEI